MCETFGLSSIRERIVNYFREQLITTYRHNHDDDGDDFIRERCDAFIAVIFTSTSAISLSLSLSLSGLTPGLHSELIG